MEAVASSLIPRAAQTVVEQALRRSPVGPRQCGKTTLARQLVSADSPNYFDLEDPVSLARLDQRLTALQDLADRIDAAGPRRCVGVGAAGCRAVVRCPWHAV